MDLKRLKLISDFLQKLGNHTQKIQSAELINENLIQTVLSRPNFKYNQNQSFQNLYDLNTSTKLNSSPLQGSSKFQQKSPEQKYIAQIIETKGDKPKEIIQVTKGEQIFNQILCGEHHEKIINNCVQGTPFQWNKLETKFLYLANPKESQGKYALDLDFNEDEDLEEYKKFKEYVQDYGEQMVGIVNPQLFEFDLENNVLNHISIPKDILVCYPQYADEKGETIILQGFKEHPEFKYGIMHCFNRDSDIYFFEKQVKKQLFPKPKKDEKEEKKEQEQEPNFKKISEDVVSLFPKVSPDLSKVLYFHAPIKGTHMHYLGVKQIDLKSEFPIKQIVNYSDEYKKNEFMGVAGFFQHLQSITWLNDSTHLLFNCLQEHNEYLYLLNVETTEVKKICKKSEISGGFSLLSYDQKNEAILASHGNQVQPSQLNILKLTPELLSQPAEKISESWKAIDFYQNTSENIIQRISKILSEHIEQEILEFDGVQSLYWKIKDYSKINTEDIPQELKALWENNDELNPLKLSPEQRPLIVFAHGGPHAMTLGGFSFTRLYFLLNGYNVLAPNFSGSTGFGQKHLEALVKNIVEKDINEIRQFVTQVIDRKLCDPKKVVVTGGSYGGMICGQIAGKHHDMFRCVVMLNAVLNMAFEQHITDIPEWVSNTSLGSQRMNWNHNAEDYKIFMEKSPMQHPAKIPVLNFMGQVDRRVPYAQGLAYHAQCVANNTEVHTYVYPESNHNLADSLQTEFELVIKTISFIEEQLLKK